MGIRLDRYVTEMIQMFGRAQHELRLEEEQRLEDFFIIERGDDGHITQLKAREITLDLIDRFGYINALDIIQDATSIAIDKAYIKFNTDIDVVPTDDPEDEDGFVIETNVKRTGLFKSHNFIEMKIWVKGHNESEGMRILRSFYHERLMDEVKGFSKVKREEKSDE